MRTTIVPAQITTVEDRIAGRLGLSQMLLLITPIFGGCGIFVILPPFFSYAVYKVVLIVCCTALSGLLAIRIKGKILLFWAIILLRYNLRPKYYVFNKNSEFTREMYEPVAVFDETEEEMRPQEAKRPRLPKISTADLVRVEEIIANPAANLHVVTNKKGEFSVRFTEVHQESLGSSAN